MKTFPLNIELRIEQLLRWSEGFPHVVFLNSNSKEQLFTDDYHAYEWLLAVSEDELPLSNVFEDLKTEVAAKEWVLGYFGYDLKNDLEHLSSSNTDIQGGKDYFFFKPSIVLFKNTEGTFISGVSSEAEAVAVQQKIAEAMKKKTETSKSSEIKSFVSKEEYISNVKKLKEHIQRGDIYEINYCIGFIARNCQFDPVGKYLDLNSLSPMPFSAFVRNKERYVLCASPERFIAGRKNKIISQPIKGTARRGKTEDEDRSSCYLLSNSEKERSENVMIVDLVRNDLSKVAERGSVQVEELFGIKTFRQLHQMISTVVAQKKENVTATDIIAAAFPMGSMTGAPKVRAMELIEQFENTKRGIYSGAIGYFAPNGNFDFNVVIRSIFYNSIEKTSSFMVGSAITINADPEAEYEECLLKASAMIGALNA